MSCVNRLKMPSTALRRAIAQKETARSFGRKMAYATMAAINVQSPDAPPSERRVSKGTNERPRQSAVLHRSLKSPPPQVVSAKGKYLTFSDGTEILDSTCGAAVACIGYQNERVKKAMVDQIDKFSYCNSMLFGHAIGEELADELIAGTKGVMSKAYVMCSGLLFFPPPFKVQEDSTKITIGRLGSDGIRYENGTPILYGTQSKGGTENQIHRSGGLLPRDNTRCLGNEWACGTTTPIQTPASAKRSSGFGLQCLSWHEGGSDDGRVRSTAVSRT